MKHKIEIIFGLLLLFTASLWGQLYNIKRFSIEENLPRSGVYSLCEDSLGFLWIGTEGGGVSVFDGESFRTFTMKDGLAMNIIRVVFEDDQGRLWFGTQGAGVTSYDGKTFTTYNRDSGLTHNDIRSITQDNRGTIWLGTFGGGITRIQSDATITTLTEEDGLAHNRIRALLKDSAGNIWIGSDGGLNRYNGREFQRFTTEDGLPNNRILCLFEDGLKDIWMGTPGGTARYDGRRFTVLSEKDGLIHDRVRAITQDNYGNFWFGTRNGVSRYDGNTFTSFSEDNGLSNNRIRDIKLDSLGNLWFGTYFGGINRYTGDMFVHYSEVEGLLSNQVLDITGDSDGNIWLGTFEGISQLTFTNSKLNEVNNFDVDSGLINPVVRCVFLDSAGMFWFGTEGGISILDDGRMSSLTVADGLVGEDIRAIYQAGTGAHWVGTVSGLSRISLQGPAKKDISITNFTASDGLNGSSVSAIIEDRFSNLWLGFLDGGISIYDGDRFSPLPLAPPQLTRVTGIIRDEQGDMWVSTEGQGLFQFTDLEAGLQGGKVKQLTTEDGLFSNQIYQMIFDDEGNLWAGSEWGVDMISPGFSNIKHYGREEGFFGIETNPGAAYKDDSGKIWFGTIKGATTYNPFANRINRIEPYTHITDVDIFARGQEYEPALYADGLGARFELPLNLRLPHNRNNITLNFVGINLTIPSRVLYSWRLEGFERDWALPSRRHEVSYSNLPPGDYTFLVKAANEDGVWNQEPARFSFRVKSPFWRTWWFFAICGLTGFGFFVLYVKIRERRLVKEKKVLEDRVRERTSEINHQKEELEVEKKKSDELLLNILPKDAAEELKLRGKASPKHFGRVSVLFTDFVGFTKITEQVSHDKLVEELDRYFIRFDEIIEGYNLEKIKTVGDSYMCAAGLRTDAPNNSVSIVLAGLEMQRFIHDANIGKQIKGDIVWKLRVGINTGSIIAGVVGKKKFTYDIWGDTVNIASRMETSGEAGQVNISGASYLLVKDFFVCTFRGKISAKNKGNIDMYFIDGIKPQLSIDGAGIFPNDDFLSLFKSKAK